MTNPPPIIAATASITGQDVANGSTPVSLDSPSSSYVVAHGNNANVDNVPPAIHSLIGDDAALSQEFRQRLWALFRQIESEFERECKRICSESYTANTERTEKESSDHEELNFAKKISTSHFSQKIKQQYKQSKQSTSRFVSTFRDRGAIPTVGSGQGLSRHTGTLCWKVADHRDGIWEVSCLGRGLVGTACADGVVRLWTADNGHCSLVYLGHAGSVNSVRFKNGFMLTASGDGTAHLVNLPADKVSDAISSDWGKIGGSIDNSGTGDDDSATEDVGLASSKRGGVMGASGGPQLPEESGPELGDNAPAVVLRNPSSMYQTASMYPTSSVVYQESAPLSAADFLLNRDQIVTASWDRLGRIYDIATGSEVSSLTGHDSQLTDVRTSPVADHSLAVTSSKDCTFRLWDFRCTSTEIHVQQGHNGIVSSVNFVGNSGEKLISAGADRSCKLWDLRQSRNPLHVIRTDSAINRLAVHPNGRLVALPMDNRTVKVFDLNLGTRIARLPRNANQSHSRIVTSVSWNADGSGRPNFFSVGFDQQLLAWHLQLPVSSTSG